MPEQVVRLVASLLLVATIGRVRQATAQTHTGAVSATPDGQENVHAEATLNNVVRECIGRASARSPDVDGQEVLAFYLKNNPEALRAVEHQQALGAEAAEAVAKQLVDRFVELEYVRVRNPEEYVRLVEIERLDSRCRALARRIRTLAEVGSATIEPARRTEMNRAKQELRTLLQEVFTATQQHQALEINRLEAEVRELRRLLDERQANSQILIDYRFRQLAGDD